MNKTFRKLVLSFSVATTAMLGLGAGAGAAQAQTVPVNVTVTQTASNADLVNNNYVSDDVVNAVGQLPMNANYVFPYAKAGFTTARVDQTGENVGIQYKLENGTRTPVAAFNLDDPSGQQLFDAAVSQARAKNTPPVVVVSSGPTYFAPLPVYVPTYTYVRPVRPIVLFGPVFRPWTPVRVFSPYDYHRHDRGPTIIVNTGHNDHGRYNDRYRDNDRHNDRDHRGGDQHRVVVPRHR